MICPKCQEPHLQTTRVKGKDLTVEACSKCKGIWFDAGELGRAMAMAEAPLSVPRNAVRLVSQCPKCGKPLYAFHYPGTRVAIEACRRCAGLWLDAGEFGEIRKARESLPPQAESGETAGDVEGVKGALLRFIDTAIDRLMY
jgi:Zn-finger nucleic acid-binding protein